jgi:hypothetical protein
MHMYTHIHIYMHMYTHIHTRTGQMYLPKRTQVELPIVQLDHTARRREREVGEIAEVRH